MIEPFRKNILTDLTDRDHEDYIIRSLRSSIKKVRLGQDDFVLDF